jgi:hypothetical protein
MPCVVWDLSDHGARIAPARYDTVPDVFILSFAREGSLRRPCRIVWRKKPYIGIEFFDADPEVIEELRLANRTQPLAGHNVSIQGQIASVGGRATFPIRQSSSRSLTGHKELTTSVIALGLLLLLLGSSAIFYVAGLETENDTPWALQVCDSAASFCAHPEWGAISAVLMGIVYFSVKRMEL